MNLQISNKTFISFFILFLLSAHNYIFAQETAENRFMDNVRLGGSLGVNFGDGYFSGYLAPKAIYDFNRFASAGIGTAGTYTNASNYSAYSLNLGLIGLFRPLQGLEFSTELEENYVSRELELEGGNITDSYWYPALFLGIGYTTGNVTAGIRYDVLYDEEKSIYGNAMMPFVSIFF